MIRFKSQSRASFSAFSAFRCRLFGYLFNVIVSGFEERICLDVLADLAGNFCSFFESKRTESETALTYLGSTRSLALGRTHDRLGSHAHNSTKFSWGKFSWSEVKSRNSRKYCATKIWSYTVNAMRFCKILMLIYCVKLDHALYSINYGILFWVGICTCKCFTQPRGICMYIKQIKINDTDPLSNV